MGLLTSNLEKITEHGQRADGIVRGMLDHSRGGTGEQRNVDLKTLVEEALNLVYHGARAQDQNFNITLQRDLGAGIAPIELVSNAQNIYAVRTSVANVLGFTVNQVRVSYFEGSSVYGGSPQNDPAEVAALLSKAVDAPVRVQFMRWDEQGWDNYGRRVHARYPRRRRLVGQHRRDRRHAVRHPGRLDQPAGADVGLTQKSTGITYSTTGASDANNSGTQYNLKNRRVTGKSVPLQNNYFKTAPLRAPNAPQTCFAYEQFVDELAHAANMDPYLFRLQNVATLASDQANGLTALTWDRWKNVLTKVAQMSNWQPKVANSVKQTSDVRTGAVSRSAPSPTR